MKTSSSVCFNIRNAWHVINRMYNSYGENHDVTVSNAYVLLNLYRTEGTPSTQIAPTLGMEPTSMSRQLKSLEEAGLIVKRPDKHDGRLVNIFLTAKGEKKKEIARKTVKRFNDIVRRAIPKEKLEQLLITLESINDLAINEQNRSESKK